MSLSRQFLFVLLFVSLKLSYAQLLPAPVFSYAPGYYPDSIFVSISCSTPGAQIYYTVNGSRPTQNSILYTGPVLVKNNNNLPYNLSLIPTNPSFSYPLPGYDTSRADNRGWLAPYTNGEKITVLKAIAYKNAYVSDSVAVATYIIRNNLSAAFHLPVLSLSIDSTDFYSNQTGIYVYGFDTLEEGNYNMDVRKKIHAEFFETNGSLGFSQYCDAEIHGNGGRHAPQKSLGLTAQKEYGSGKFHHQLFPDDSVKKFDKFLLRNSGHRPDCNPHDDVADEILDDMDNEIQHIRHCIVFINGEYWGIQTIKDILNNDFFINKFHWRDFDITILVENGTVAEGFAGDELPWDDLLAYVNTADMTDSSVYKYVVNKINLQSFTDFQCSEIFLGNGDWPNNNTKFWRFRNGPNYHNAYNVTDGRWRWMAYDMDAAFGGDCSAPSVSFNALTRAFDSQYGTYTRLLRKLSLNSEYKKYFINRFADLLNSDFLYKRFYKAINTVDSAITPGMTNHVNRWRYPSVSTDLLTRSTEVPSLSKWNQNTSFLYSFAAQRHYKTRKQFMNYFLLSDTVKITLTVNDSAMGKIRINSLYLDDLLKRDSLKVYPWTGTYFNGNPVTIEAMPFPGYKLKDWNASGDTSVIKNINVSSDTLITAVFEADTSWHPLHYLYINELSSKNDADVFDEYRQFDDWVEIYNPNTFAVDLNKFYLTDDFVFKQKFRIHSRSDHSLIPPKGFIVLWADHDSSQGPLHMNFKLNSGGDDIYLIAPDGNSVVDSVIFGAWPVTQVPKPVSLGRNTDGDNTWMYFSISTANDNNRVIEPADQIDFYVYPNPVEQNSTLKLSRHMDVEVFDVTGRLVIKQSNAKYIPLSGLSKGLYIIRPKDGKSQKFIIQ